MLYFLFRIQKRVYSCWLQWLSVVFIKCTKHFQNRIKLLSFFRMGCFFSTTKFYAKKNNKTLLTYNVQGEQSFVISFKRKKCSPNFKFSTIKPLILAFNFSTNFNDNEKIRTLFFKKNQNST